MSETCQKLAFTHPIVVLKSGLKHNWMKKLDRVNQPLESVGLIFLQVSKIFNQPFSYAAYEIYCTTDHFNEH